jgi:hypothetical protein
VGLGFGNAYQGFPGGVDRFAHFLSSGNDQWEKGRQVASGVEQAAGSRRADSSDSLWLAVEGILQSA